MSTRAIRALRERESYSVRQQYDDSDNDDDDDTDDDNDDDTDDDDNNSDTDNVNTNDNNKRSGYGTKSQSAFILVEDASDEDVDDEDDDNEDSTINEMHNDSEHDQNDDNDNDDAIVVNNVEHDDNEEEEEDEDIDALLEEFQLNDINTTSATTDRTIDRGILYLSQLENIIMANFDWKELDFQYTLHNNNNNDNKSDNSNTNDNNNSDNGNDNDKKNKKKSKSNKKNSSSTATQNSIRSYDHRINPNILFDLQQRKKRSRVGTATEESTNYCETLTKSNFIFGQPQNDKIRSSNSGLFMIRYDQYRKGQPIQIQQPVTTSEVSSSSSTNSNNPTTTLPWPYNDKNLLLNLMNTYNSDIDNTIVMMTATTTAAAVEAGATTNAKTTTTSAAVKSVHIDDSDNYHNRDAATTTGSDSFDDKNKTSAVNNNDVIDMSFCKYFYSFHCTIQYEKDCLNFDKLLSILNYSTKASTTTTTRSKTNDNTMINTILSYVIDHPYCCPALLFLSVSLLERIHSTTTIIDSLVSDASKTIATASYTLLHRCLHLYELSMSLHFKHLKFKNKTTTTVLQRLHGSKYTTYGPLLIDYYQKGNQPFFDSLQKLIRLCYISRESCTALATCRLLLSMDPLRDPLAVLLIMDRFVLATSTNTCSDTVQWFINFVESNIMQMVSNDSDISSIVGIINENLNDNHDNFKKDIDHYSGGIFDLPNIMFSYPLALYMMFNSNKDYDLKVRADHALEAAIKRFPLMIEHILNYCTILDTTTYGEFYRQKPTWDPLLDYMKILAQKRDRAWTTDIANRRFQKQSNNNSNATTTFRRDMIYLSATNQICERIIENYSYHCSKFWNDDTVLQWLYECMKQTQSVDQQREHEQSVLLQVVPRPPSPAIIRYINFDLSVYDETIPQLSSSSSSSVDATTMIDIELLENVISMDPKRRKNSLKNKNKDSRLRGSSQQQQQQNQHHYRLLLGDTTTTNTSSDPNDSIVTTVRDELEDNDDNIHSTRRYRPGGIYFGPPTHGINPDWPLVEVFWRSFLPWNYVIGVKPSSSQPAYQPAI